MIWENVQLALVSLKSNKMRALLTALGIIIGIMSIIAIMVIGDAMTASVTDSLSSLGTNNITVSVQERGTESDFGLGGGGQGGPQGMGGSNSSVEKKPESDDLITDKMIADLQEYFPYDIMGVSLDYSGGSAKVKDGDLEADVSISGANADYFLANNITLLSGRLISDGDVRERSMTAVVSDRLVAKIFPSGIDPIGQTIRLYKTSSIELYTIIGVYEYEEMSIMGMTLSAEDVPTTFYIPVTTAKQDLLEKNYTGITVIGSTKDVESFTDLLQSYFDGIYATNDTWKANVTNMASMLDTISSTLSTISLAIAVIAGISLLVGGIGVMNIMLVSVTERTREIGTRKALGAKTYHIQLQFVMEAIIISSIGGIIGLLLGIGVGAIVAAVFGVPLVVSPLVTIGSVLFSMAIGVFFGLFPANKAAKLDPIEALRYE